MRRPLLNFAGFLSLLLAVVAGIGMFTRQRQSAHLVHAPTPTTAGIALRYAHGRLYVITRTDPELKIWPVIRGWEYRTRRDLGLVFLAPTMIESVWTKSGIDWGNVNDREAPHAVRYIAIPWWMILGVLFLLPVLTLTVRFSQYLNRANYCPVCLYKNNAEPCPACGTIPEEGAIPCNALNEIPTDLASSPASQESASFCSARIIIKNDVAVVRSSRQDHRFSFVMIAIGAGALFGGYRLFDVHDLFDMVGSLIPGFAGAVFLLIGLLMLIFPHRVRIDREAQQITVSGNTKKETSPLEKDDKLQILAKNAGMQTPSKCYELNLVLHDGKRINLLSHGDGPLLRRDAHALADFLGCPIIDQTGERLTCNARTGIFMLTQQRAVASS